MSRQTTAVSAVPSISRGEPAQPGEPGRHTVTRAGADRQNGGAGVHLADVRDVVLDVGVQMGYQVERGPASAGWLRIAVIIAGVGALLGLVINRRLPG